MSYETVGFGYLGIGMCGYCNRPNHVFIDSQGNHGYCAKCMAMVYGSDARIPSTETFPILADKADNCESCELPILEDTVTWGGIDAYLADATTLVRVHRTCSRIVCDQCTMIYANASNRHWRETYTINSNKFSHTIKIEGEYYCGSCANTYWQENDDSDYFECNSCESYTHYDNSGWFDGERYCEDCIDSNVYDCGNCGESQWDGNGHDCEDDEDESLIHSYSYRPSPYFFGEGKYHFGFELEVEARRNNRYDGASIVQNALGGRAYLKDDGSISDGFEIVTHPHTLENYHKEFNWSVLERLQSDGYRSWNTTTCGLHVHVSRTAFGDGNPWSYNVRGADRSRLLLKRQSHELRFMKLIYDNQRQVERIAGRSNNSYATFQDKGNLVRKVKMGYQTSGRYSAINTENDDTIEIRVFKGSLRKERVLSAIEFVHACVEYTRDIKVTSKNHALSWLKFTGYVANNAELYPNLVTIMSESFANDTNPSEENN